MKKLLFALLTFQFLFTLSFAQKKKLTYDQVMMFGGPRLTTQLPRIMGWLDDDNYLTVTKNPETESAALMKVNAATGEMSVYIDYKYWDEQLPEGLKIERAKAVNNFKGYLFTKGGDIYYLSIEDEAFTKLQTLGKVDNPKVSPNGRFIVFTRDKDLYAYDIELDKEIRLTDDAAGAIYNGWSSWVYMEEILGRSTRHAAYWFSPDGNKVAFMKFDDSPVPEFILTRADGIHGEVEKERYPKAGDPNPLAWIGIADLLTGKIVWADAKGDNDQYIAWPFWSADGGELYFEWLNREMDNLKIYSVDISTGKKKEFYDEKQSTWVDWFEDIYVFKNNSGLLLRSAVDGWAHLYYYGTDGKLKARLTKGDWQVTAISRVDEKNGVVYFTARKDESTEQQIFKVNLNGKDLTQLTHEHGWHSATVSPHGKYFFDRWSNITTPAKLDLYSGTGKFIRNIGDSKSKEYDDYDLAKVELFRIPSGDGYRLPAKWYLPPDFDKTKKYPVIISIYGGPGAGTVRNSAPYWMQNYYLAQEGIIVFEVDHRGSGHFGKKGVDLMHRQLGKWEMHDYIAAVKWLESKPFIDTNKIAITGGSYGGYVTAYALTFGSDYFDYGIAEYSVTDWHLYDNVYTERYMDTPEENPEGYKISSVVENADKYKGGMLIIHGTMDDNVHMQNTIQLIDKLEDLNKDFEMMLYPNQRHGIGFPKFFHNQRNKLKFWFENLLGKELKN